VATANGACARIPKPLALGLLCRRKQTSGSTFRVVYQATWQVGSTALTENCVINQVHAKPVSKRTQNRIAIHSRFDFDNTLDHMSSTTAFLATFAVSALNAGVVFMFSLLGIYGDGSVGAMPVVLVVGLAWVGGFFLVSLRLVSRGQGQAGVKLCGRALPYGILALLVGWIVWMFWMAASNRL